MTEGPYLWKNRIVEVQKLNNKFIFFMTGSTYPHDVDEPNKFTRLVPETELIEMTKRRDEQTQLARMYHAEMDKFAKECDKLRGAQ